MSTSSSSNVVNNGHLGLELVSANDTLVKNNDALEESVVNHTHSNFVCLSTSSSSDVVTHEHLGVELVSANDTLVKNIDALEESDQSVEVNLLYIDENEAALHVSEMNKSIISQVNMNIKYSNENGLVRHCIPKVCAEEEMEPDVHAYEIDESISSQVNQNINDNNENRLSSYTRDNSDMKLRCVATNVNGLHSKLDLGIIDQYWLNFGIISSVETKTNFPNISNTLLHNYCCYSKDLPNYNVKYSFGGFHGICTIVNPNLITDAEVISDMSSECVLWMKMKYMDKFEFIYGAVYVPCETSSYYHKDAFLEIEHDILELNIRYDKLPTILAGDFNGHTEIADDCLQGDVTVAEYTGCELLTDSNMSNCTQLNSNSTDYRYSQDLHVVSKNGSGLLSLCKAIGFKIVNGRIGSDKFIGRSTCHKTENASVIDYLVVSDNMFPYISDFKVEMFDSCISDVHCPIEFELSCDEPCNAAKVGDVSEQSASSDKTILPSFKFKWSPEIADDFKKHSSINFDEMKAELEKLLTFATITQNDVDSLCSNLNELFIDTAKSTGAYSEINTNKVKNNLKRKKVQPWMDHECFVKRKEYYKVKNKLKRMGEKSMCNSKSREFKRFMKAKKKNYHDQLNKKIRALRSNNSKEYWSLLNNAVEGSKVRNELCLETLMEHFKMLSHDDNVTDENTVFDNENVPSDSQSNVLNIGFEVSEIMKIIRGLKNHKASGIDCLKNEFLKNAPPDIVEFICRLFNVILETGFIPDVWCKGMIMPLYKNKGERKDPDNYRGITLLSCLGKLFTACLSARIADFMYKDNKMGVEQAGFRPEYSTMDHVFTLHCIIEYYKQKNDRVYVAFVDYSKAFDLIDRSSLWLKLIQNGVKGKIINVIHNMYKNAKSCVKSGNNISDFFTCNIGVRQGENLSPILFAIYLNDFKDSISKSFNGLESMGLELHAEMDTFINLYVLLYADDTIILAESAEQLQKALRELNEYCRKWSLKINTSKTKIVIFSRGKVKKYPKFYVDMDEIEVKDDYVYLGVVFNYNGSFKKAISKQISQARKAMYALITKARILRLPFDIIMELFNVCVVPILLYGSEVWGYENITDLEVFHRQFLRIVLKAYQFTPNAMLYGESGSFDLKTLIDSRIVNFWAKLRNCNKEKISSLLSKFIEKIHNDVDNERFKDFSFNWCAKITRVLECTGFSQIWVNPSLYSCSVKRSLSGKLKDIFKENWLHDINNNTQCSIYKLFKHEHGMEKYLVLLNDHHKYIISNFRMRVHNLPITRNRFSRDNMFDVVCKLCDSGDIGDEIHYLFHCHFFQNDRSMLFSKDMIDNSLLFKFCRWQLVFKEEPAYLGRCAKFLKIIMSKFEYRRKSRLVEKERPQFKLSNQITRTGRISKPPARFDVFSD